jgi:NhaA family Na+:H+ antiporter
VSLLIGELTFGAGTAADDNVKIGVLGGSVLAALLAAVVLRIRNAHYRQLCADEERDADHDDRGERVDSVGAG